MAIDLAGTVRFKGEPDEEMRVRVQFQEERLRLSSGEEVLGEWSIRDVGIHSLNEGFVLRVEGEEILLITEDDAALADEMELKTVSPRVARQVAARHRPEDPEVLEGARAESSKFGPIAFALAGALMVVGATFLRSESSSVVRRGSEALGGVEFWLAFTIGGVLMVAAAYVLAIGARWGRVAAIVILVLITIFFGIAVSDTPGGLTFLTAYGFIAGGLAVGVAVLFSGLLEDDE